MGKGPFWRKSVRSAAEVLSQLLSQPRANTRSLLILGAHGLRMNRNQLRTILTCMLGIASVVVWAFVMWAALTVSTVVLDTLQAIVDLAALS